MEKKTGSDKVWCDFTEVGESANLKSEDIKRVKVGMEQCWKDLVGETGSFEERQKTNVRRRSRWSFFTGATIGVDRDVAGRLAFEDDVGKV